MKQKKHMGWRFWCVLLPLLPIIWSLQAIGLFVGIIMMAMASLLETCNEDFFVRLGNWVEEGATWEEFQELPDSSGLVDATKKRLGR